MLYYIYIQFEYNYILCFTGVWVSIQLVMADLPQKTWVNMTDLEYLHANH